MRKYNCYNKNYLLKHISKLFKEKFAMERLGIPDVGKYNEINCDITQMINLLFEKESNTLYGALENFTLEEKRDSNKEYFNSNKENIPIIREFCDIYDTAIKNLNLDDYSIDILYDTAYTHKKLMHMVRDFYMSIPDKEIRDIFDELYKKSIYNVRICNSEDSYCGGTESDGIQYITVSNSPNYSIFSTLIHEFGHAIHQNYVGRPITYSNSQYTELVSIFFQILSFEYMRENNIKNKDRTIQESIALLITMNTYANNLEVLHATKNKKFKDEDEAYNCYLEYLYEEQARIAVDYDAYLFSDYLIPYILDIELLSEYKNDPEKSIYMLKDMIKNDNIHYLNKIQNLGLHPNKHLYKYMKHITK